VSIPKQTAGVQPAQGIQQKRGREEKKPKNKNYGHGKFKTVNGFL
jgi:hypothetical protein